MVKQVLDNGLTILIEERPGSPVVAIVTHVNTGYFNEPDDQMGISHVFEHMFFKGTSRRPGPEDIARETKALGGVLNAGTGYESTTFYVTAPAENFEQTLDIQFDALSDLLIDPDELSKEIEVVIQEAKQKRDNPSAFSLEKMWERAFDRHRIRRWRIGYPDQLRNMTRDDLLRYHRERYTPGNIIISVVGGVESGAALQLIDKLYSEIPMRNSVENPSPEEYEQTKLKYLRLKGDIKQKLVQIGFQAPKILDSDYYPLSVAIDILGEGRSSRLYQSIMEQKQIVSSIGSFYSAYKDIGVVTVSSELLTDDPSRLAVSFFEEIEKLKKEPIRRVELEKIKNIIESDLFFEQEQVLGRANRLAYFEALGDWRMSDEFVDRLRKVDAIDVARVAAKYLTIDRATILEYMPESVELPEYTTEELEEKSSHAVLHVPGTLPLTAVSADGNITKAILPSGATLIAEVDQNNPVVGVVVYFKGGRSCENPENAGITELALRASLKGTSRYSSEELAQRIENLGTFISITNSSDFCGYSLRVLSKNFEEGFELLSDVIADPAFHEEEVDKEKEALRADIRRLQDSSFGYASDLLAEVAFPNHPYGLPDYGRDNTIAGLTREQVAEWHKSICVPAIAVVSIVGNIHIDSAAKAVENLFQRLGERHPGCGPALTVFPNEIKELAAERDRAQTAVALGFPGVTTTDPARYSLDVIAALCSGLGGRLFAEVRGRLGLAYVVSAASHSGAAGGIFIIYTATSPDNEILAREAVFSEFQKLKTEPADPDEIANAKSYMKGVKLISMQTSVARARERAANEIYGLGIDGTSNYLAGISRVTPEDILNTSIRYFNPSRYCLGAVRGTKTE
ncbi:MAG: pitrilysin family protein [Armatimonadota bacterium]